MQEQMFIDRHASKQLGLVEIDGHVVAFDIRRMGARALRIDGDAKRMRADLDRAFADKGRRVNNRDLIVVAIGGHDQRARKAVIAQKNIAEGPRKCLQS